MFSLLSEAEVGTQSGIPSYVWIIVGIIAGIVFLIFSIKNFWMSKIISILFGVAGVVISIYILTNIEYLLGGAIICGVIFAMCYVFLMGNAIFDSGTEGDYLILGTLVHDTNHPFRAFCYWVGGIIPLAAGIFAASYYWTFVIGLIAFIITVILNIALIVERVKSYWFKGKNVYMTDHRI